MKPAAHPPLSSRRRTRTVHVGPVAVGGDSAVSVQTMTKTDTRDTVTTLSQIRDVAAQGCDIVRLAVIDEQAARALGVICKESPIPVVADIHFDHRLALIALDAGVHGLRINPGNIGDKARVRELVEAARPRRVPIRIGVNKGSLEKDLLEKHHGAPPAALVESAMRHVRILEDLQYEEIKISVKSSDVWGTLEAYRQLTIQTSYPLHVGVTEAGTFLAGTIRSSVAMGILLSEGIGDTLRVSLTDTPAKEVKVGLEILRSLGLRPPGPSVISCPTCGRIQVDVIHVAQQVEAGLETYYREQPQAARPVVAVMGCMVNGPGEARDADIAVAGGRGKFALYVAGTLLRTVDEANTVEAVLEQVRNWNGVRDPHVQRP
jgi:(E)-4-hydroxy-3-methylbut-2-enyl-diphosphate synthase